MKTSIITGASRGIGLATAKLFMEKGWKVIGTYNQNPISIDSPNLQKVRVDFSSPESIEKAVNEIKEQADTIDVLVNNAGIASEGGDETIKIEKVREVLEVNLFGLIDFTQKLLPLIKEGGHIVNVDSDYGSLTKEIDNKTGAGYRISKAALNMYTKVLAKQMEDRKIIVSSLDPGWVKTDMGNAGATEDEAPDREPEEPAEEIYYLTTQVSESGFFWRENKKRDW